jgi:carbamoyl-phosphate synthase large subunit
MNILLFPSGSLVAKEIYDALKYEKNLKLYGTDSTDDNVSSYYMEHYIPGCPFISDETATLEFLSNLVHTYNIKYIYPAFDSVIAFLKIHETRLGARIIAPDLHVIELCNSKLETYNTLKSVIPVPILYDQTCTEILPFPLYSKPIVGYGSRNHKIIRTHDDVLTLDSSKELLLELLPGKEYTVDCFSDLSGNVLYAYARERTKTLNGVSVQSHTCSLPNAHDYAKRIQSAVPMVGAWFFQVKYNKDNILTLLEIACRIPGAMCVNRARGINFPALTLQLYEGHNVNPLLHNSYDVQCHKIYKNHYKTSLYYTHVYCDLDDTLIIHNKLHYELLLYLYKCVSKGIKVICITRNPDPHSVLNTYRISVFDNVISLERDHSILKSTYITEPTSIFIDDSYIERNDVSTVHCIPCFSPSDIELLTSSL